MTEGPPTEEELARFYNFVEKLPNGCHFWNGARSRGDNRSRKWYGSFWFRGRMLRAHRFANDIIGGTPCPPGHHRDHLCEFSLCVNLEHIEVVTHAENERRKQERRARAKQQDCPEGHVQRPGVVHHRGDVGGVDRGLHGGGYICEECGRGKVLRPDSRGPATV